MKEFQPCEKYDGKKITKIFADYGRKANVHDLAVDLNQKVSISFLISKL